MKIFYSTLLIVSTLIAQSKEFIIDKSYSFVEYEGTHFLHNWVGKSHSISGSILVDHKSPSNSSVDVSIPIFSFDSNNGNRDSNMLLYVEEHLFPNVSFISKSIKQKDNDSFEVTGVLNFHGLLKNIVIPIEVSYESDFVFLNSTFSINLDDYNVERPKLMLTAINKNIEIKIHIRGLLTDN